MKGIFGDRQHRGKKWQKSKTADQQKVYQKTFYEQLIDQIQQENIKLTFKKIKQQLLMNLQDSFPTFNLQLNEEFETSDEKFSLHRKQNNSQTLLMEDGNVAALSTIGKRNSNLDCFSYLKKDSRHFLAVFDGHGDDKVPNYLKQNLLQRLSSSKFLKSEPQTAIKSVLKQVEQQVLQFYEKGSTVLLAIVDETQIIAANVGDSKLFGLGKQDGKLIPLTKQHDLSNHSEVAEIMSKGGLIFKRGNQYRINGQLNISRSIGDRKHKLYMSSEPDIYRFDRAQFKKIMLATDGFHKHELFESELCKRSLKQIENKIRKGILGYGFNDNATILSLKLKQASPNSTTEGFFQQNTTTTN